MKINPNINLRDRSKVTLKDFKGLDTLSSSVNVSAIHASEMQNLISRDGVNHKRFGWKENMQIKDVFGETMQTVPIRGIFNFTIHGESFVIVYAGKSFYTVDMQNNRYLGINKISLVNGTTPAKNEDGQILVKIAPVDTNLLTDMECKFFMNGNKVYFVGCGDYLVFSKWQNGYFELRRVVGNEDVYIPTTTENISCQEDLETGVAIKRITTEERNLLSPYSNNLLIGKKLGYQSESEYDIATFYLDQKNFIDLTLTVQHKNGKVTHLQNTNEFGNHTNGQRVYACNIPSLQKRQQVAGSITNWVAPWDVQLWWSDFQNKVGEITIAKFSDGRKLVLKQIVVQRPTDASRIKFKGVYRSCLVSLIETDFVSALCIRDGNNIIELAQSYGKYACGDIVATENGTDYPEIATLWVTITFPNFNVDLSKYNVILSEDYKFADKDEFNTLDSMDYTFPLLDSESFTLEDENGARASAYAREGRVVLYPVKDDEGYFESLVKDEPNITAQIKMLNEEALILSSSKAVKFGLGGKDDRLFIVDATGYNLRWSKDLDFTYFGDKSFNNCGTSDANITGMERLNDSTLMVVKEYSPQEPSIYVITGTFTSSKTEAGTEDYAALFTPKGYSVGMGAVGQLVNFNGECLMVAKDGLYSIAIGENMTIDSRYILHRSRQISNTLEKFDLARAKCVSFDGRLYVCVGGDLNECFVADSKYATSFGDDAQNVISYEWWRWTNIPVCTWGFVNNELWFGTEDGKLCSFSKEFYDEKFDILSRGDIGYVMNNDSSAAKGFVFNKSYGAKPGDYIRFACDMFGSVEVKDFEVVGDETRLYLPLKEYEDGEIVYIAGVGYQITKHDTYISIPIKYDAEGLEIYKNHKGILLEIEQVFSDGVTIVKTVSGKYPLWLPPGEINPIGYDLVASLIRRTTVVAKWVTGAMDLGTTVYSKTITYLILTGEKSLTNNLKYGIRTRFTKKDYQDELFRANNDINLSLLDFQSLSLDFGFASSYTKKLNIRDVNFVMFYFVSDTEDDIALNSVQIEFKLHKRNIGVR